MKTALSASVILKMSSPGDLFTKDDKILRQEYKELAKLWHPDVHADPTLASTVMTKINLLYQEGLKLLASGTWAKSGQLNLKTLAGKAIRLNYRKSFGFELGTCYVSNGVVTYLLPKTHRKFYDNYLKVVKNLSFADDKMRHEFQRFLPEVKETFETDEFLGLIVSKPEDVFALKTVKEFYGGKLEGEHVTWVLSSLYNMACFLHYNKLSHNGLTVENYFISPEHHSGVLLGGWWYAVPQGEKMLGAPSEVFNVMSSKVLATKQGSYSTDLNSIRTIGRELLGWVPGMSLASLDVPSMFRSWLEGTATSDPFQEYSTWSELRDRFYGGRRFRVMDVTAEALYKEV